MTRFILKHVSFNITEVTHYRNINDARTFTCPTYMRAREYIFLTYVKCA